MKETAQLDDVGLRLNMAYLDFSCLAGVASLSRLGVPFPMATGGGMHGDTWNLPSCSPCSTSTVSRSDGGNENPKNPA